MDKYRYIGVGIVQQRLLYNNAQNSTIAVHSGRSARSRQWRSTGDPAEIAVLADVTRPTPLQHTGAAGFGSDFVCATPLIG